MNHVAGYVLALDMTARKPQLELMKNGHPWLLSKGFDTACAISKFIPKDQVKDVYNLDLSLWVNKQLKQESNTSDLIFKIPDLVAYISRFFTLHYGDLILTGTPCGVAPVRDGDLVEAEIKNLIKVKFPVVKSAE
jgi:acylpyruvate hydrolase